MIIRSGLSCHAVNTSTSVTEVVPATKILLRYIHSVDLSS